MIKKTDKGYQVIGRNNTIISEDTLSEREAKILVKKIEAYKASRGVSKVVQHQLPKKWKKNTT